MSSGRGLFGLPKLDEEERQRAVEDPGPSWGEWVSSSFAKTYLGLGFFIADAILVASWFGPPADYPAMFGTTALALYLEYLAWQYLWYQPKASAGERPVRQRPDASDAGQRGASALARAVHPFARGRWSPAAERRQEGVPPTPEGLDPREFV
jgi:hypothetical protein